MSIDKKLIDFINNKETIKIVASVGKAGIVDSEVKPSLYFKEDGTVEFLEYLESSDTNRNLIHSLWFEHNVSILAIGRDNEVFELRGIPVKAVVSGSYFEKKYIETQQEFDGKLDLSTIWIVKIEEIINKNVFERYEKERKDYPIIAHLDRLRA